MTTMFTIATNGGVDAPFFWIETREEKLFNTYEDAEEYCRLANQKKEDGDGTDCGIYYVEEYEI